MEFPYLGFIFAHIFLIKRGKCYLWNYSSNQCYWSTYEHSHLFHLFNRDLLCMLL